MRRTMVGIAAALMLLATGCEDVSPELVEDGDQASAAGVGQAGEEDAASSGDGGSSESDAADGPYQVGDTVAMGELAHVLHGVRWSEGEEFFGPDEGERWLVLDIELTNTGESSEAISSIMMWTFVDSESRAVDMTITGDEQGSLDGELGAGRSMRGEIAYSVPEGHSGPWELLFEPQLLGFGQAVYAVTEDDVTDS